MSDNAHSSCPAETVLEEYALDRLVARKAAGVENHLRECEECREKATHLRAEGDLLTAALGAGQTVATGQCLDDEVLAQYVDVSLTEDARAHAEEHLAACGRCQRRLVALYRELKALQCEQEGAQAPGEVARYESDAPPAPSRVKPDAPAMAAPAAAVHAHKRTLGVVLLGVGGACALGADLWPWAGSGVVRLAAALVMASGVAEISQRGRGHAPSQAKVSGFGTARLRALAVMAFVFACIASNGVGPTFVVWSAAVVSFCFWLSEASMTQRRARKDEKQERCRDVLEPEERKERSM